MAKRTTAQRHPKIPRGWVSLTLESDDGPITFTAPTENDPPQPADEASAEFLRRLMASMSEGARLMAEEWRTAEKFLASDLGRLYVPKARRRWKMGDIVRAGRGDGRRRQTEVARATRRVTRQASDAALASRIKALIHGRDMSISGVVRWLNDHGDGPISWRRVNQLAKTK